jgi:hypothetical protein
MRVCLTIASRGTQQKTLRPSSAPILPRFPSGRRSSATSASSGSYASPAASDMSSAHRPDPRPYPYLLPFLPFSFYLEPVARPAKWFAVAGFSSSMGRLAWVVYGGKCFSYRRREQQPRRRNVPKTLGYCWRTRQSRTLRLASGFFEGTGPWKCLCRKVGLGGWK